MSASVIILIYDPVEEVKCWIEYETQGTVEDIYVLPSPAGQLEDTVYYVVNRTIQGATVRYVERWAFETECRGADISKCADAHATGTNSPASATITGLGHLIAQSVIVWADGVDQGGPYTVDSTGSIYLPVAVADYVVGLTYAAQFKSTKLAYAAQLGTALTQKKRAVRIGFILADAHAQGLECGPDFDTLQNLPLVAKGAIFDPNTVWDQFDDDPDVFPATWDSDARICLQAIAPRPMTVLAAVPDIEVRERT
jgi:hypothetical protein